MTEQEKMMLKEVYEFMQMMKSSSTVPLSIEQALQARGFYKSFPPINHDVTYPAGFVNIFVAPTSGASPTTQLNFQDGILRLVI